MSKSIEERMLEVQRKVGAVVKGSDNPFFSSTYADLGAVMEVVKGPLNEEGIFVTHEMEYAIDNGKAFNILTTALTTDDGQRISSSAVIPDVKDAQKLGSAITYLKRYTLQALMFIPSIDDDGNAASNKKKPKTTMAAAVSPF